MNLGKLLIVAVAAFLVLPSVVYAGGAYIDDLTVSNDGKVVFSDDFNDGSISDWTQQSDVSVITLSGRPKQRCLLTNRKTQKPSEKPYSDVRMYHDLSIQDGNLLEVSFVVCLPPASTQALAKNRLLTAGVILYSGTGKQRLLGGVNVLRDGSGYAWFDQSDFGNRTTQSGTQQAVVPEEKWVTVTLRADPRESKMNVYVDGKRGYPLDYEPSAFRSIKGIAIECGLGDQGAPE